MTAISSHSEPWVQSASELRRGHRSHGELYWEALRVASMSAGLYRLPAGGTDPQTPHKQDEVYVVLRGKAQLQVAGADHPVRPGSLAYVPAGVEHRFHSVESPLEVLVVFAPAESRPSAPEDSPGRPGSLS